MTPIARLARRIARLPAAASLICAALWLALYSCSQPAAPPSQPPLPQPPQPHLAPAPTAQPSPPNVAIPATAPKPAPTSPPTSPPADTAFTQITTGKIHACGLRENATALCWGSDLWGLDYHGSLDAPAKTAFRQISAGLHFTCGLRQDATIACWGLNSKGQASPPQGSFTEIAAGRDHACAVPMPQRSLPTSELICWGWQFPNGAETLPLDAPLSGIQSGNNRTCGLTPQGDMACLRINQRSTKITPGPFTQLAVGVDHICALRQDGSAFCQGQNYSHQASPPPTQFTQIAAGWHHTCGITRASRLECWGSGRAGSPGERLTAPDGEFAAISIAWRHSCALRANGHAVCFPVPNDLPDHMPIKITEAFGGAKLNSPVDIFPWPSGGLAIVDRSGVIAVHHDRPDAPPPQTILDITHAVVCCPLESGMLSAALDPQFDDFPFLYVWYRAFADNALGNDVPEFVGRLARFRIERGGALKNSELPILDVHLTAHNHLGGAVRFGADGMLYLGIGDSSTPDDAQALYNLRGKIIRIDVRGANAERPYRVPPDNPFVDTPGARPEIWAYGLRNPWRMAFDPQNPRNLFVADVGEKSREEVSIATAGANLGWPLCEGDDCRDNVVAARLAPPAIAYPRTLGCAIIGGVTVPWLDDGFIFSDLCSRRVWLLERDSASDSTRGNTQDNAQDWRMREITTLVALTRNIVAFGAGADGSVYVLSHKSPALRLQPPE